MESYADVQSLSEFSNIAAISKWPPFKDEKMIKNTGKIVET